MNATYFMREHLTMRVILGDCFINLRGESHPCQIDPPDLFRKAVVKVSYKDDKGRKHELSIDLYYLNAMETSSVLFYFSQSEPDGLAGTLVIPEMGFREDGDEEEEDEA